MGSHISFFKNNKFKIKEDSPLLATNKYCNNCETNFLFNEYYKHLSVFGKLEKVIYYMAKNVNYKNNIFKLWKTRESYLLYGEVYGEL